MKLIYLFSDICRHTVGSSEFGRFISADSELDNRGVISQNLFAYCGNNPVNHRDDDGNLAVAAWLVKGIVGGIIGAATGAMTAAATGGNVARGAFIGAVTGIASSFLGSAIGKMVTSRIFTGTGFLSGLGRSAADAAVDCVADSAVDIGEQYIETTFADPSKSKMEIIKSLREGEAGKISVPTALLSFASSGMGNVTDVALELGKSGILDNTVDAVSYGLANGTFDGCISAVQTVFDIYGAKEEQD